MTQPVNHDFEHNCKPTPPGSHRREARSMPFLSIVGLSLLVLLAACGGPKPPVRGPNVGNGGGTVYDDRAAGNNGGDATQITDDSEGYTGAMYEEEDIGSQTLNVIDTYNNNLPGNLDWSPVFFEFDQSALTQTAREKLARYAQALKSNPGMPVLLEGHADIRGTDDYNLALGERRAQAVKRYLLQLGVPETQMRTISYGELKPLDPTKAESAWAKNRRVSFTF